MSTYRSQLVLQSLLLLVEYLVPWCPDESRDFYGDTKFPKQTTDM